MGDENEGNLWHLLQDHMRLPVFFVAFWLLCEFSLAVYRFTLHPLARFSGPFWANAFSLNLFKLYHDVFRDGQMVFRLQELCDHYGPVVRLGPNELYLHDPQIHAEIFKMGTKFKKADSFYGVFQLQHSLVATTDVDAHRRHRATLEKHFTQQAVDMKEFIVTRQVELLCQHLRYAADRDDSIFLCELFRACCTDVASEFVQGEPFGALTSPERHIAMMNILDMKPDLFRIARNFQLFATFWKYVPRNILAALLPIGGFAIGRFLRIHKYFETDIQRLLDRKNSGGDADTTPGSVYLSAPCGREQVISETPLGSLYAGMRSLDSLSAASILRDEVMTFSLAGAEAPGFALETAFFYLSKQPDTLCRLRHDIQHLKTLAKGAITYRALKTLPFLTAVIKETLRFSHGACILFRSAPAGGIQVGQVFVPERATVAMSHYTIHMDERIWERPRTFAPERWLGSMDKVQQMNKFLVAFSAGPAKCIGIEVAYMELYHIISVIVTEFDILPGDEILSTDTLRWNDHWLPKAKTKFQCRVRRLS
ncbi:MAG: hypothetical protein M1833_006380 [Piccolia ochrophora]|nr:MAG: hypothetical protein M1833_006380 [Piccolia ochrophora]